MPACLPAAESSEALAILATYDNRPWEQPYDHPNLHGKHYGIIFDQKTWRFLECAETRNTHFDVPNFFCIFFLFIKGVVRRERVWGGGGGGVGGGGFLIFGHE